MTALQQRGIEHLAQLFVRLPPARRGQHGGIVAGGQDAQQARELRLAAARGRRIEREPAQWAGSRERRR